MERDNQLQEKIDKMEEENVIDDAEKKGSEMKSDEDNTRRLEEAIDELVVDLDQESGAEDQTVEALVYVRAEDGSFDPKGIARDDNNNSVDVDGYPVGIDENGNYIDRHGKVYVKLGNAPLDKKQAHGKLFKQHWAIIRVSPEMLEEVLRSRDARIRVTDGLPDGVKFISAHYNHRKVCFDLTWEHESFPETEEGSELPILPMLVFEEVWDYGIQEGPNYRGQDMFISIETEGVEHIKHTGVTAEDHFILKFGKWDDAWADSRVEFPDVFRVQRDQLAVLRDLINVVLAHDPSKECFKIATTTDLTNRAADGRICPVQLNIEDVARLVGIKVTEAKEAESLEKTIAGNNVQPPQEEETES